MVWWATLLAARSIAYSDSGSGTYLATTLFPKLGIAEQIAGAAKLAAGPKALAAGARFKADHPAADWVENFRSLHPVSAKTGDGIEALRDELHALEKRLSER